MARTRAVTNYTGVGSTAWDHGNTLLTNGSVKDVTNFILFPIGEGVKPENETLDYFTTRHRAELRSSLFCENRRPL